MSHIVDNRQSAHPFQIPLVNRHQPRPLAPLSATDDLQIPRPGRSLVHPWTGVTVSQSTVESSTMSQDRWQSSDRPQKDRGPLPYPRSVEKEEQGNQSRSLAPTSLSPRSKRQSLMETQTVSGQGAQRDLSMLFGRPRGLSTCSARSEKLSYRHDTEQDRPGIPHVASSGSNDASRVTLPPISSLTSGLDLDDASNRSSFRPARLAVSTLHQSPPLGSSLFDTRGSPKSNQSLTDRHEKRLSTQSLTASRTAAESELMTPAECRNQPNSMSSSGRSLSSHGVLMSSRSELSPEKNASASSTTPAYAGSASTSNRPQFNQYPGQPTNSSDVNRRQHGSVMADHRMSERPETSNEHTVNSYGIERLFESLSLIQKVNRCNGLFVGERPSSMMFNERDGTRVLLERIHVELETLKSFSPSQAEMMASDLGIEVSGEPTRESLASTSSLNVLQSNNAYRAKVALFDNPSRLSSSTSSHQIYETGSDRELQRPVVFRGHSNPDMGQAYAAGQPSVVPAAPNAIGSFVTEQAHPARPLHRVSSLDEQRLQVVPYSTDPITLNRGELPSMIGARPPTYVGQSVYPLPPGPSGMNMTFTRFDERHQHQLELFDRRRMAGKGMKRVRKRKNEHHQECLGCSAKETPEWRKGPMGPRTLCNACGLLYAKLTRRKQQEAEAAAKASGKNPEELSRETEESPSDKQASLEALRAELNLSNGMRNRTVSAQSGLPGITDPFHPPRSVAMEMRPCHGYAPYPAPASIHRGRGFSPVQDSGCFRASNGHSTTFASTAHPTHELARHPSSAEQGEHELRLRHQRGRAYTLSQIERRSHAPYRPIEFERPFVPFSSDDMMRPANLPPSGTHYRVVAEPPHNQERLQPGHPAYEAHFIERPASTSWDDRASWSLGNQVSRKQEPEDLISSTGFRYRN